MRLRVASAFLSIFRVSTERRSSLRRCLWCYSVAVGVPSDRAGGIAIEALPAPVLSSIAGAIDVFC
jgi:hypothetical protein